MGLLVDGQWRDRWYDTKSTGGRFVRTESAFRARLEPAAAGDAEFPAVAGRYRLFVSYACPWAHRTLVMRKLKGLEDAIAISVVDPFMGENGWELGDLSDEELRDLEAAKTGANAPRYLHELYRAAKPDYTGRVTVPVLWDRERATIVNNESAEIVRFLNAAFVGEAGNELDFYPTEHRDEIDELNAWIYPSVNNGVYRCGFATTQQAYEEAFDELFAALDRLDERLATRRYLVGERLTEADWRLFTTLVRFDAVYHGHFKCNRTRIADFAHLSGYLRELFQWPGVAETVRFDHIKTHYYRSHPSINPTRIVPKGPALDLAAPHGRERLPGVGAR